MRIWLRRLLSCSLMPGLAAGGGITWGRPHARWSGLFEEAESAARERAFRLRYAAVVAPFARRSLLLAFLVWCAFAPWDSLVWQPEVGRRLLEIRLLIVAPVLAGLWGYATRWPLHFRSNQQVVLSVASAGMAIGLLSMMTAAAESVGARAFHLFWQAFIPLCFFQYAMLGLLFTPAMILGASILAALVAWCGVHGGAELAVAGPSLLYLGIVNVIGLFICGRTEQQHRGLFLVRERRRIERRARTPVVDDAGRVARGRFESAPGPFAADESERFFASAYHSLQQPLSVVGLYLHRARAHVNAATEPSVASELSVIDGARREISQMFKGVRDIWEIGSSAAVVGAVDLERLLSEIAREMEQSAGRKGLMLRVRRNRAPQVWSDRTLLKRALTNLVGNAIKYTERGGVVVGAVDTGSHVRIDVWDSGIGIAPEFQMRIFDEYYRVQGADDEARSGLGLGLSIVRRIERMLPDHRLSFYSKPGHGSRFSLAVPVATFNSAPSAVAAEVAPPATDEACPDGTYVVVAEDEPLILRAMVTSLRQVGCRADGVHSASAVGELLTRRRRCPDALITDLRLRSGESGLDAVAAMRQCFVEASATPVLFVTGELAPAARLAGFAGPHEILPKPIEADRMLRQLRMLIARCPVS